MRLFIVPVRLILAASLIASLSACMLGNTKPSDGPSYGEVMKTARADLSDGNVQGARKHFSEAASIDPAKAEPWHQLASIEFDRRNYGRAITNAEEALHRDGSSSDVRSILTVAGLRVAMESLGRMRDNADLKASVHDEAEVLAEKMRKVLDEDSLVAGEDEEESSSHSRRNTSTGRTRTRRTANRSAGSHASSDDASDSGSSDASDCESSSGSDPFGSLSDCG